MTAATALARSELPLRSAVYALVLAPLVIPQIVTALGLFLLFEPAAMLGSPHRHRPRATPCSPHRSRC